MRDRQTRTTLGANRLGLNATLVGVGALAVGAFACSGPAEGVDSTASAVAETRNGTAEDLKRFECAKTFINVVRTGDGKPSYLPRPTNRYFTPAGAFEVNAAAIPTTRGVWLDPDHRITDGGASFQWVVADFGKTDAGVHSP